MKSGEKMILASLCIVLISWGLPTSGPSSLHISGQLDNARSYPIGSPACADQRLCQCPKGYFSAIGSSSCDSFGDH
jgi:hypothetical protein